MARAKKRVTDRSIAGERDFPGKAEYLKLVEEKLRAGSIDPERIARKREVIKRAAALKQAKVEGHVSWIVSQKLVELVSSLPKSAKNNVVLKMSRTASPAIHLKALDHLDKSLEQGFSPGSKKVNSIIHVLEKMLLSRRTVQVKRRALEIISDHNLLECLQLLEWFSTQSWLSQESVLTKAREIAAKMREPSPGKQ